MDYFNPLDVVAVLKSSDPDRPYAIRLRDGTLYRTSEETGEKTLAAIEEQNSLIGRIVDAIEALPNAIRFSG